ncbi:ASCH domain protein [Nocardioides marinus]|uniref:Putative transcriptional regulator n=1 Tax=Nocardioides marinus TaxID=374514 RepID=A0A7Y9YCM1_9ACTN|nr:ASCH domain protein [Nocardioides marinus]NYI08554.1 putative transcriptional regulator [Nocardioides marinus]
MGTRAVGRVALLSIHPRYADGILAGAKRVEFRKRPLAADVTHVVVYATAPVSAVVGAFSVEGQHTLTPAELWQRFADVGGIEEDAFAAYYGSRDLGTGIAVGEVLRSAAPMCLRSHLGISHPPQSFRYLAAETAQAVLRQMRPAPAAVSA